MNLETAHLLLHTVAV